MSEEEKPKEVKEIRFILPECCRESWDSCVHCAPKNPKKQKKQIGL